MKKMIFLFATFVLFSINACGPSVEGETKNWDRNVEQLKKMQADYPAYADLIKKQLEEAQKVYTNAGSASDDVKKADMMREANQMLNNGCVGNLKNMSTKLDELTTKKRELKNMMQGKTYSDISFTEMILTDCDDAVKKAEKVLSKQSDNMDENPCIKIESAFKGLTMSYDDVNNAISKFNKADADAKKLEEKQASDLKADVEKKEEAAKPIECAYCGKMNEAGSTECKSCGAALK